MPVYEFRCSSCGHIFDSRRSIDLRDDPALCPQCQEESHRLISPFASKTGWTLRPSSMPQERTALDPQPPSD